MKQRTISVMLILFLTVTLLTPIGTRPAESYGAGSFSVRTSVPSSSDPNAKYYYSDLNRFWKAGRLAPDFKYYDKIMDDGRTGGYVWGNCTWWAYSRASEVLGEPLNPNLRGNAGQWWDCNKKGGFYPYGSEPKAGAIVVYATHVAFVEQIVNGQVYVSESGWQTKTTPMATYDDIYFHYGIPWHNRETPKGYIYVTDKAPVTTVSSKPVSYSVRVSVDQLRMRSGPGTGYANMGYIPVGVHQLKAITTDGEWGQLASNGYWIFLEYAEKVAEKDGNNNLKTLKVSGYSISPKFKAATTNYSLTVPSNVSSVTVKAVKSSKKASLSGTGAVALVTGSNVKTVTVTAENGAAKVYTLNITRCKQIKVKVTVTDLNMRGGPGTKYDSKGKLKKGTYAIVQTKNGWGKLKKNGYWIDLNYTEPATAAASAPPKEELKQKVKAKAANFKVKVTVTGLNMRSGPGKKYKNKGTLKKGTYTISQTKGGWGKLKKNGHWIKLEYTKKVTKKAAQKPAKTKTFKVKVKAKDLNMRSGPGKKYKTKGKLKKGTYKIVKTKNGWGKLKKNGYWIKLSHTKRV